jgi:hypothetical protein
MNIQYVTWVCWHNLILIALFSIFDSIIDEKTYAQAELNTLINSVNMNQLPYFLIVIS